MTIFHALDRAEASICETVRSMGRRHFFAQGWSFDLQPERLDGLPGVDLTWTREREGGRTVEYRYGVGVNAFQDLVGLEGMVSAGAIRYWLDGMLLDVSLTSATERAHFTAADAPQLARLAA